LYRTSHQLISHSKLIYDFSLLQSVLATSSSLSDNTQVTVIFHSHLGAIKFNISQGNICSFATKAKYFLPSFSTTSGNTKPKYLHLAIGPAVSSVTVETYLYGLNLDTIFVNNFDNQDLCSFLFSDIKSL